MSQIANIGVVALGIGLVIFVHELGHFLAARWCGVRVVVFSLGFGPRLLSWRRGSTLYQLAAIPLGGYCRMAGEERRADGLPPAPDDLASKGVGQRFFIYSGGVLMNVLFALAVFPILFHVGVPFLRPQIDEPLPGSPAWHARLQPGTEIVAVNGTEVFDFTHVHTEVALADSDLVELLVRPPGSAEPTRLEMRSEQTAELGIRTIGVLPALERDGQGSLIVDVAPGSPAEEAGLRSGDAIAAVRSRPSGPRLFDELQDAMRAGETIELEVVSEQGLRTIAIEPRPSERSFPPRVGITPPWNRVADVRQSEAIRAVDLRPEDRILSVGSTPILAFGDLARALELSPGQGLELTVLRGRRELSLSAPAGAADPALLAADVDLRQDLDTTVVAVSPAEAAARAGLRDGDRILKIDGTETRAWKDVTELVGAAARSERSATFSIERAGPDGELRYLELAAAPEALPIPEYGISLRQARYVFRTDGLLDSFRVGALCSWRFLEEAWLTLKGILRGSVSSDNVGGIISIGVISYTLAKAGIIKLLFFLCMLSINLAFINVLPIPVLDGGHLFFLLVEKLKGSPVSERVLGYSQMVGMVLIVSLIVFVTYNDLVRVLG